MNKLILAFVGLLALTLFTVGCGGSEQEPITVNGTVVGVERVNLEGSAWFGLVKEDLGPVTLVVLQLDQDVLFLLITSRDNVLIQGMQVELTYDDNNTILETSINLELEDDNGRPIGFEHYENVKVKRVLSYTILEQ